MITGRIAPFKHDSAVTVVATTPGDWPGPALDDGLFLGQHVVSE